MKLNRRKFVVGAGSTLAVAGLSSSVWADASIPVEIVDVYPVADVVILENTGDEDIDLGGYVMDWEYGEELTQTDTIPQGTTIGAGQTLSVWTGFQSTQISPVEADVRLGDYGNGRINASEPDVIALLAPSGEVVDETSYSVDGPSYNAGDYDDGGTEEPEEEPEEEDVDEEPEDNVDEESEEDVDEEPEEEPEEDDADEEPEEEPEEEDVDEEPEDDEADAKGDDCPDEEDGYEKEGSEAKNEKKETKEKKSTGEDCPEEEPEPEPEPEDDC